MSNLGLDEFDSLAIRIAVLGGEQVGRTAFIARFIRGIFLPPTSKPFETKFRKKCEIDGKAASLLIFDAGNGHSAQAFDDVSDFKARIFFLLFSASSRASFMKARTYADSIPPNSIVFLIANKCDLPEKMEHTMQVTELINSEKPLEPCSPLSRTASETTPGPMPLLDYRPSVVLTDDMKDLADDDCYTDASKSPSVKTSIIDSPIVEKKFREVSSDEGFKLAQDLKCFQYLEASAKDGVNVIEAFEDAVRIARKHNIVNNSESSLLSASLPKGAGGTMARSRMKSSQDLDSLSNSIADGIKGLFLSFTGSTTARQSSGLNRSMDFGSLFLNAAVEIPAPSVPELKPYVKPTHHSEIKTTE